MQTEAQRRWTRLIHVAKNQTGIDDDAYRAILAGSAGVASAAEIKTWAQFGAVMRAFRNLGFTPRRPQVEPQGVCPADNWLGRHQIPPQGGCDERHHRAAEDGNGSGVQPGRQGGMSCC